MPEGDTIHRAAATLNSALSGKRVTRFESVYATLTRVDQDAPLAGRDVEGVVAVGKHLLMRFSGGLTLRTHMRMSGSWHLYRPGERWQRPARDLRILVATEDFVAVGFRVPVAEFVATGRESRNAALRSLGPDLLAGDFDAHVAASRIAERSDQTIEAALLDQRALAGIGNVYKSEALFVAGVHPFTPVRALEPAALARVVDAARRLMRSNLQGAGAGGMRRTTRSLDPEARLWVYGRGGRPCRRCGTKIERAKSGPDVRSTYWCPVCQPAPGDGAGERS